jgi:hypothetical protein
MKDRRVVELSLEKQNKIIHTLPVWARERIRKAEKNREICMELIADMHKKLREVSIYQTATVMSCRSCKLSWFVGNQENHKIDCPAKELLFEGS